MLYHEPKPERKPAPSPVQPAHGLSPAQLERLAMLAEEAGEIVQAVMKIMRHGYDQHHPDRPAADNRAELVRELGDLRTVRRMMIRAGDISGPAIDLSAEQKKARLMKYTHHQQGYLFEADRDAERRDELEAGDH